jgi:hypothetical protein
MPRRGKCLREFFSFVCCCCGVVFSVSFLIFALLRISVPVAASCYYCNRVPCCCCSSSSCCDGFSISCYVQYVRASSCLQLQAIFVFFFLLLAHSLLLWRIFCFCCCCGQFPYVLLFLAVAHFFSLFFSSVQNVSTVAACYCN